MVGVLWTQALGWPWRSGQVGSEEAESALSQTPRPHFSGIPSYLHFRNHSWFLDHSPSWYVSEIFGLNYTPILNFEDNFVTSISLKKLFPWNLNFPFLLSYNIKGEEIWSLTPKAMMIRLRREIGGRAAGGGGAATRANWPEVPLEADLGSVSHLCRYPYVEVHTLTYYVLSAHCEVLSPLRLPF